MFSQQSRRDLMSIRCVFSLLLVTLCAVIGSARPLSEYQMHVQQAVTALDTIAQSDEGETDETRLRRITETLAAVRIALPATETVEWGETSFKVDNPWLHRELEKLEKAPAAEQGKALAPITERFRH